MADAYDLDVFFLAAEEFAHRFGLGLYGAGGSLLDEDVAVLAVLEGEEHQVNRLLEAHYEAGHLGFGEGDGVALADLVDPEGYDAAAGAHHVAVTGAADLGVAAHSGLGHCNLLFDGFGDAHGVDGIGGFVGGEADDAFHSGVDGGVERIVCADDVGLDGFHREEFAARYLLEGGGVEDVIDALHGVLKGALVAHVAYVELDFIGYFGHACLEVVAHIVLLLLVAGEDTYLAYVCAEEPVQHCVAETARATSNQKHFVFENTHIVIDVVISLYCTLDIPCKHSPPRLLRH